MQFKCNAFIPLPQIRNADNEQARLTVWVVAENLSVTYIP